MLEDQDVRWIPVEGSMRIVAAAYDPDTGTIYVRFPYGAEWWFSDCSPQEWEEFHAAGLSRDEYIDRALNYKPNGRYGGD